MIENGLNRASHGREESREGELIATLTPRQQEVIPLVAEGLRNRQIAQRLHISQSIARHQLSSIIQQACFSQPIKLCQRGRAGIQKGRERC